MGKKERFMAAVSDDNLDAAKKAFDTVLDWGTILSESGTYRRMSPRMMWLVAMTLENYFPRSISHFRRNLILPAIIRARRLDLLEPLAASGLALNCGDQSDHQVHKILDSNMNERDMMSWLGALLSQGYDRINNPDEFVLHAADKGFVQVIDFFAQIGFDIHRDGEKILRELARNGERELCSHVVKTHSADVPTAIRMEEALGHYESVALLRTLPRPAADKPVTVESLSAEVRELKEMVGQLTSALQPTTLDKPQLGTSRYPKNPKP